MLCSGYVQVLMPRNNWFELAFVVMLLSLASDRQLSSKNLVHPNNCSNTADT